MSKAKANRGGTPKKKENSQLEALQLMQQLQASSSGKNMMPTPTTTAALMIGKTKSSSVSSTNPFATDEVMKNHLFRSSDSTDQWLTSIMQTKQGTDSGGAAVVADAHPASSLRPVFSVAGIKTWTEPLKDASSGSSKKKTPVNLSSSSSLLFRSSASSTDGPIFDSTIKHSVFDSQAWSKTLQPNHVEVDYTTVFPCYQTRSTSKMEAAEALALVSKTPGSNITVSEPKLAAEPMEAAIIAPTTKNTTTKMSAAGKRKPTTNNNNNNTMTTSHSTMQFITDNVKDEDVLLGRGGRTNNHIGNERYLKEKLKIQPRYMAAPKEDKTALSQELVDVVHQYGGRFLKLDGVSGKWYEVDNSTARKKASQTLREINTPEVRAAKRAKYSTKK